MENAPWLAAVAAAIFVFVLVAWRLRAPQRAAIAAPRDPRLARVNGAFEAADTAALEARLAESFRVVLAPDGAGGFAVIERGPRYVQLGWGGGETDVTLEAVSSANLPRDGALDPDALRALAALGFAPPDGDTSNHWQRLAPSDASPARLARLAARTLAGALGAPPPGGHAITTELEG
jgi:hypothetical protein